MSEQNIVIEILKDIKEEHHNQGKSIHKIELELVELKTSLVSHIEISKKDHSDLKEKTSNFNDKISERVIKLEDPQKMIILLFKWMVAIGSFIGSVTFLLSKFQLFKI